jgi:DNA-binding CsgD family transcriptional regulator
MSIQTQTAVLQRFISAIGEKDFAAVTAQSVLDWLDFDLATVVVHRRENKPGLMFDNFDLVGANRGVQNYVAFTHCLNPVLQDFNGAGAFRARDFRIGAQGIDEGLRRFLIESPREELGYRTVGWPERLEEIGLYFEACKGVVELGIYRERGVRTLSAGKLNQLANLCMPIAAAFNRHSIFVGQSPLPDATLQLTRLSPRELEVTDLLLIGCSSEAIALRLGISLYTIKDHRKQIFRKLGIGALAELFALHRRSN